MVTYLSLGVRHRVLWADLVEYSLNNAEIGENPLYFTRRNGSFLSIMSMGEYVSDRELTLSVISYQAKRERESKTIWRMLGRPQLFPLFRISSRSRRRRATPSSKQTRFFFFLFRLSYQFNRCGSVHKCILSTYHDEGDDKE